MEVRKHDCLSFFYEPNQERVQICDRSAPKRRRLGEEVKDEIRDPGASGDDGVG
jgi:hypothetical protein